MEDREWEKEGVYEPQKSDLRTYPKTRVDEFLGWLKSKGDRGGFVHFNVINAIAF